MTEKQKDEDIYKMKTIRDVVIVAYGRSPIGRSAKGSLAKEYPTQFAATVLNGVLKRVDRLPLEQIDDVIVGCAKHEVMQGKNMARIICQAAGLPDCIPAQTINRFCSSGLQSVATGANAIMAGQADIIVAGGVESMSMLPMNVSDPAAYDPLLMKENPGIYIPMGLTAENVAEEYGITRTEMDAFALESQRRAARAREEGEFRKEIIPVPFTDADGNRCLLYEDECIRANTSMEKMSTLSPCFKEDGLVTAANSSGTSDGAAFIVLMSVEKALELDIKPIARFLGFVSTGVNPEYMGIGPMKAVPRLMKLLDMEPGQFDVIELNEAFAAQAIPCIRTLGLSLDKVNPRGGALALGHPLGATGSILLCKALSYLEDTKGTYGLITMCIGGGMGAAGAIEML
ncbi:thiolase family protein [Enterocloster aldenensis]|uniref:thiolase family protein n=1 Tax=Enterocloster aldenensis TaxID=358742 RepID=UPI004025CF72